MRFIDLHGVACLSPLARCTPRRWRVHYFIMILQWSLSGSIQPDPHFFNIWLSSCLLFWETFHRCLGLIWITEIAHLMMDDFMSPDFWPIIHQVPYWGIFSFWMRVIDLHGVVWSPPLTGCAQRRWPIHYFYDDSSVEHPGSHPVRPTLLGT